MKILVADGYALSAELVSEILSGHDCRCCTTIEDAVTFYKKEKPDLLITSMRVPRRNADATTGENLRVFNALDTSLPVIIITGLMADSLELKDSLNVKAVIQKPFGKKTLLSAMERFN